MQGHKYRAKHRIKCLVCVSYSNPLKTQGKAAKLSIRRDTTDSCIGPWLAFAIFGLPGAFAYRALNTLDS